MWVIRAAGRTLSHRDVPEVPIPGIPQNRAAAVLPPSASDRPASAAGGKYIARALSYKKCRRNFFLRHFFVSGLITGPSCHHSPYHRVIIHHVNRRTRRFMVTPWSGCDHKRSKRLREDPGEIRCSVSGWKLRFLFSAHELRGSFSRQGPCRH